MITVDDLAVPREGDLLDAYDAARAVISKLSPNDCKWTPGWHEALSAGMPPWMAAAFVKQVESLGAAPKTREWAWKFISRYARANLEA